MTERGVFEGKTILFVEDDPLLANDTIRRLKAMGFDDVFFATDLCQADALKSTHRIDLALLDVHIGPVNTLDLANELADAGVHVVFTSSYERGELGDRLGDFAFVQKPYNIGALSVALEETLNQSQGSLAAE